MGRIVANAGKRLSVGPHGLVDVQPETNELMSQPFTEKPIVLDDEHASSHERVTSQKAFALVVVGVR